MLKKLLTSAIFAGFGAGLIAALLQITLLVPILLESEEYESGAKIHFESQLPEPSLTEIILPEIGAAYAPPSAFSRNSQTVLWTLGTYFGFALLLVAGFGAAERHGHNINARIGIVWGLAGFTALQFAPAAGLPPELPGAWAADMTTRQFWWGFTVICTTLGLAGIAFGKHWGVWAIAIFTIAMPHVVGAPQPERFGGVVPPELAAHFVSLSLFVGAAGWACLGMIAGYFWHRSNT